MLGGVDVFEVKVVLPSLFSQSSSMALGGSGQGCSGLRQQGPLGPLMPDVRVPYIIHSKHNIRLNKDPLHSGPVYRPSVREPW